MNQNGQELHCQYKKIGIKIKLWGVKVSVKIMSLQTTLKTVFGGSRTGVFEDRVPDGRSASENALLSFVICVIRGAESAL